MRLLSDVLIDAVRFADYDTRLATLLVNRRFYRRNLQLAKILVNWPILDTCLSYSFALVRIRCDHICCDRCSQSFVGWPFDILDNRIVFLLFFPDIWHRPYDSVCFFPLFAEVPRAYDVPLT